MNSKNEFETQELERKSKEILETFNKNSLEPSPFLKTRILAELESKRKSGSVVFWKRVAVISMSSLTILALAFIFLFNNHSVTNFKANTGQILLVKVDVNDIKDYNVAYAKVELPDDVTFYSKTHLDVSKERSLTLFRDPFNKEIPFVVRSEEKGVKEVKITFYDDNDNVILEKKININFVNHG